MQVPVTANPPVRQARERHYVRFGPHQARMAWRRWRRARPFWAGFWTVLGGIIVSLGPFSAYRFVIVAGTSILVGIGTGVLIAILGLFFWFIPRERYVVSVIVVLLGLASLITSDYGGFVIGMLLTLIGGSLGFAWVPVEAWKPRPWHRQARREWKAEKARLKALKAASPQAVIAEAEVAET